MPKKEIKINDQTEWSPAISSRKILITSEKYGGRDSVIDGHIELANGTRVHVNHAGEVKARETIIDYA